ncbi:MAG: hypothetical protein MZV63_37520 [Marinilabiliales bacterium]|nr:hypothetical protein [Marinilabiliales bacterium]
MKMIGFCRLRGAGGLVISECQEQDYNISPGLIFITESPKANISSSRSYRRVAVQILQGEKPVMSRPDVADHECA